MTPAAVTPTVAERLADVEYAAAWRLVGALPEALARRLFRIGADVSVRRNGAGARQLRANLARVRPCASPAELDALLRDGVRSYARYWCETFRLPVMDPADIHDRTATSGTDVLFRAIDAGSGVVIALPHSGNWDAAGVWLVAELRRRGLDPAFTTVAQRLRPESLYRRFVAHRESLGFEVVAAEDGSDAYRALTRRLRSGGVVCLVADRDLTATGAPVTFLGAPATFPTGPARLAAMTGARLVPAFPHFTADGWAITFADAVPVAGRAGVGAATQAVADTLGGLITAAPVDWHVLQPIWGGPVPVPVAS